VYLVKQIRVSHGTQETNEPKQKRRRRGYANSEIAEIPAIVEEVAATAYVQQRVSANELTVGDIVACYLSKYEEEEPQLGVVREVTDKKAVLAWMTGDYDDSWSIMKQKNGKEWTERVAFQYILQIVKLNEENRLSDSDVNLLKDQYGKI